MANIHPFKAIRPVRNKVNLLTTRSYISYTKSMLKIKLDSNPYSFIHVINPYGAGGGKNINPDQKYKRVAEKFEEFFNNKYFQIDETNCFYIYRQVYEDKSFIGFMGLSTVQDYENKVIKKHEQTLEVREKMFTDYLNVTKIHAEPVLITYDSVKEVNDLLHSYSKERPEYEFTTHNGVLHELWVVSDMKDVVKLQNHFKNVDSLYIADGHHRIASSSRLRSVKNTEKYDKFLSFYLADDQLSINGFSRGVQLKNVSEDDFMNSLKAFYTLTQIEHIALHPTKTRFYFKGISYLVEEKDTSILPVEYLTQKILTGVLGIKNLRKSRQISYIPSNAPTSDMINLVESGKMDALFVLPAIRFSDLKAVSDNGRVLPPKSTWIEPKLRSALIIYNYNLC